MKAKATPNPDKLPRGHAYVRLRNRGYSIHVDFNEVDSELAEKMMEAALKVHNEAMARENSEGQ